MKKNIYQLVQTAIIGCLFMCNLETKCQIVPADLINNMGSLSASINQGISVKNTYGITTGSFSITDYSNYVVLNNGWKDFTVTAPSDVPDVAVVKKVTFSLRVDDNANESTFWPEQIDILLNGSSRPELWNTVWYGYGNGHLDGSEDDDEANDSDIELTNNNFGSFNGQKAHQTFTIRFFDMDSDPSQFLIDRVTLTIHWEASLPNLTTQVAPSTWSGPIVVSNRTGQNSTPSVLYAGESFVNLSLRCLDEPVPADDAFLFHFSVDGTALKLFSVEGVGENGFRLFTNHPFTFTAGNHTLCQTVDGFNTVEESNESDNEYCHTFTWVGPPVSPVLSSPADHSLCHPTSVKLSWENSAYATGYHLQVDNNSDFSSPEVNVPVTATSETVSDLSHNTNYYWRVRAQNPAGFGSFSHSRAFQTEPEPPAVPLLNSPSNRAECRETSVILDWASSAGSMRYNLQVDNNSDFSSPVVDQSIDATEFNVTGLSAATVYYWRVAGKNMCRQSAWSSVFNFTTKGTPSTPALSTPAAAATCQPVSLTLTWNTVSGAASYDIIVDNNSDLGSPLVNQNVLTASYAVTGLSVGTTYYWAVRVKNSCSVYSEWSEPRPFTTLVPVATVPTPATPAHLANCQPLSLSLSWNEVAHASVYSLQVDNNDDFGSLVVNQTGIVSTAYTVSGLNPGTTYFWRVSATSACGGSSSWSSVRSFTTASTPAVPALAAPDNAAGCQALNLTLSWNSVSGAVSYDVRVDDNSDFSSPVLSQKDVATTSSSVSGLNAGTAYYWEVRAKNSCGSYSAWSASRSFVTAGTTPDAPGATAPADGASCQAVLITLDWSNVIGAVTYTLQVDDNSNFSSPLFNQGSLASTSHPVEGLSEGTQYYWRTKAVNNCGVESPWSSGYSFTTLVSSIAAPVLTGPANNIECQPVNPILSWENVPDATGYSLQVDNNANFSSPDYQQNCTGTSQNCNNLSENTLYYWRVSAAGNCSVTSSWSDVRNFKTGSAGMTAPILTTPADSSTGEPLNLTLSWERVANATGYRFQLDDRNDFSSPLYNEDLTANSKLVSGLTEKTVYYWQVRANGACLASNWSEVRQFETLSIPSAIGREESNGYALKQNYPNPFTGITTVEFIIPIDCEVCIEFLNVQGIIIETHSGYYAAGAHNIEIKLNDKAQAGVYIYRMTTSDFVDTKRCIFR